MIGMQPSPSGWASDPGSHAPMLSAALPSPWMAVQAERKGAEGRTVLGKGLPAPSCSVRRWPGERRMLPRTAPEQRDRHTS